MSRFKIRTRFRLAAGVALFVLAAFAFGTFSQGEVILQYFNTSWNELADRMPELAEAGYTALWLPPPFKAGNQYSVGFDTFDRFDIGTINQMGGVQTRYGTGDDLKNMMLIAHRFGIRVYFDNVMAHNGGPIPGYDENSPITAQPGFVPEDFHLMTQPDGTFRKMPEWPNWGDEWQVLHRNPFGIDIAQEVPVNESFGPSEGAQFPKWSGLRHPGHPEWYLDTDLPIATNYEGQAVYTFANKEPYQDVGYGPSHTGAGNGKFDWDDTNGNGQHDVDETSEPFTDTGLDPDNPSHDNAQWGYGNGKYDMGNLNASEDVNSMLFRAVRWFLDQSKCDGFRLDAVKHVPNYFFGKMDGADKDYVNWGYSGQIQEQFNATHGFSDWNNHRDTCFNDRNPRDDALLFGEHLAEPPGWNGYISAGMRIAMDGVLNGIKENIGNSLSGMDQPGWGSLGVDVGMMYVMSHDNNYLWDGHYSSAHALILTRAGIPIVYTDGMHHSGPPDWFPKWSTVPFLGEWGQTYILNELNINRNFARGGQYGLWGDGDLCVYERRDYRENGSMSDADATVLYFALARGWTGGQSVNRANPCHFPANAYLYNYSGYGGGFYARVGEDGKLYDTSWNTIIVPSGGYFAFSWRSPEESALWQPSGGKPITIYENGQEAGTVGVVRRDGADGDPNFNPYSLSDNNSTDFSYTIYVPRVTVATNLRFVARVDGSASNVMMKLDGGVDLNSQMGLGSMTSPGLRDNSPGIFPLEGTEIYLGYEQPGFHHRQYPEKFASINSASNKIGSAGAETYLFTIGTPGFTTNVSDGVNDWDNTYTASWIWHDPNSTITASGYSTTNRQFSTDSTNVTFWIKLGNGCNVNHVWLYYTTDGATYPEGAGGEGRGTTKVAELSFAGSDISEATVDWWKVTMALTNGTPLRYKIGGAKLQGPAHACSVAWDVPFPNSSGDIARKTKMMSEWEITNFNAATVSYYPHDDYGVMATGLAEGFHVVNARAFLDRSGRASIYNTFVQTFYLDAATPSGAIVYPGNDGDTLYGSRYGLVVRGDRTVKEVWYRITDTQANNDDSATGVDNGNGTWVKAVQVSASPEIQSPYPNEWRFDYVNIAPSNTATIEVRLREITSSTNMALSDADGHFTTLTRTVQTRGPDVRLFVAWPSADGQTVGPGYGLKAYFSWDLANGISSNDLINCFTLKIDSNVQARTQFNIRYDEPGSYPAFAFALPNLYDGFPDHQHVIEVDFTRDPFPPLVAYRTVLSVPVETPYIEFVTPPVADDLGQPYYITLPSKASPTTNDRQYLIEVDTASTVQSVQVYFTMGTGTLVETGGNPGSNGNYLTWSYLWKFPLTNNPAAIEGTFEFRADADVDGNPATAEASALRVARVILRQLVASNTNDLDDDDDGLADYNEVTAQELPSPPSSTWNNGDIHVWRIYGKTKSLSPDSDADGLPDGLESGWRVADTNQTDIHVDTDGDGYPNFIADLDPPFFNTADNYGKVPGVDTADYGDKTQLKAGSLTDPNNPDTDYDGIPDGIEDADHNGWVDGDGEPIQPTWDPWIDRKWPTGLWTTNWVETNPNNADSDADGLADGYGEDKNFNGRIDGDINSNRVWEAGELWQETDPLNPDTDHDGLPDGWEVNHGLAPLDDGILGHTNMQTGAIIVTNVNGRYGDPDGDSYDNITELNSGTDPRVFNSGAPPPVGGIVIGTGVAVNVGSVVNNNEFTDWKYTDLIALDPYDPLDQSNGGDVYYRPWASDGLESSRDLVAFYARDGGETGAGGDDYFYFRVDLHDLKAHAEDSGLDIYVVIDTGNPAVGEALLPDNVDCLTAMRWEVVVAVYDGNSSRVYVNSPGSTDTRALTDTLHLAPDDVIVRTKAETNGFKSVYFNSDLDSVEFGISRQALLDAGWNGNPNQLNYQVFTTRDGTSGGVGELDGPDIQDSIRTDWIAEDFTGINTGNNIDQRRYDGRVALTTLSQWVGVNADNDRGKRIKVVSLVHGNQADQPGRLIQNLINTGTGAGYYRPLDVHQAYGVPLTMHITPTLASALQWARVDTNVSPAWRDGPALNQRVATMVSTGLVDLIASTFSDHMMPYFSGDFNANNVALAREFLSGIYGAGSVSSNVFWTPERLLDSDVLAKVQDLGFSYTFLDQVQHLRRWFGYNSSVGDDAYRVNRINNVKCLVISDSACDYRFSNLDNGPAMQLRQILNRRARTGYWGNQHPQLLVLFSNWEDFDDKSKADAYDKNIRWMASKGWIQLITPDQIAGQAVDISLPPDGGGDAWNEVDRGAGLSLSKVSHDWVQYSAQDDYDHWYVGSALNQGLQSYRFAMRSGTNVPEDYGMLYFGGLVSDAWARVSSIPGGTLSKLAEAVLHASVFETAYHNESQNPVNMSKFSMGEFAYPDTSYDTLADFSRIAQSQTRMAAIYKRVDNWAAIAPSLTNTYTSAEDVDLDGEPEYLLYNNRLFGLFERIGGRLIGAWVRDLVNEDVYQAAGNFVSYAGTETEEEGATNIVSGGTVGAYRTSCLKDWWAGTTKYVNDLYTFADRTNGWSISSSDGAIAKLVTLGPKSWQFDVGYSMSGPLAGQTLYVRNGLSPDLYDLLIHGQQTLGPQALSGGVMRLANTNYGVTVEASIGYGDAGHTALFNAAARDDGNGYTNYTVGMRDQAQTHQVEIYGVDSFAFSLGFRVAASDWDGDGMPNTWEDTEFGNQTNAGSADNDKDGMPNSDEYIANTDPQNATDYLKLALSSSTSTGIVIRFPTKDNREYFIDYDNDPLTSPIWTRATATGLNGTGNVYEWLDNGTLTAPNPLIMTSRFYRISVDLPQ